MWEEQTQWGIYMRLGLSLPVKHMTSYSILILILRVTIQNRECWFLCRRWHSCSFNEAIFKEAFDILLLIFG